MRERSDILKSTAKQSGRDPAGKDENPARFRGHGGIENIVVETEHAAVCGVALVVDGKQISIGPWLHVEGIGGVIAGSNVANYAFIFLLETITLGKAPGQYIRH